MTPRSVDRHELSTMMTRSGELSGGPDEVIWASPSKPLHRPRNFLGSERLEKTSCLILDVHMRGYGRASNCSSNLVAGPTMRSPMHLHHGFLLIPMIGARRPGVESGGHRLPSPKNRLPTMKLLDCIHAALKPAGRRRFGAPAASNHATTRRMPNVGSDVSTPKRTQR